jgi:FKBP-type peptidyl-prolyl cis-trans isomerase FkpA
VVLAVAAAACGGDSSPTSPSTPVAAYAQTDIRAGTGATAVAGRQVVVNYSLWLYSESAPEHKGTFIQANTGFPFVLGTGQVIRGWDQGVPGMQVGGLRRLILPPSLAYGSQANGPIPANASLVFDIELTSVL